MPIRKVQFCPGNLYHLFNRGNSKREIFHTDKDRYRFLQALYISNNSNSNMGLTHLERDKKGPALLEIKKIFEKNKTSYDPLVKIYADCLMPNHYHLLVEELKEGGIVRFMQRSGNSYGRYFTIKNDCPGSLFQGRFKAVHIENDDQLKYLLAYINIINPAQLAEPELKEKGIHDFNKTFKFIDSYNWSTHQEFMGRRESLLIDKNNLLREVFPTSEKYLEFVKNVLRGKENRIWSLPGDIYLE
jgi:putative transposase